MANRLSHFYPSFTIRSPLHGEQDPRHGGKLHWVTTGPPILADKIPVLRENEVQSLPLIRRPYERIFDLSQEEDRSYYNWIRSHVAGGVFTIDFIERHWDEESKSMKIYLEWSQVYRVLPQNGGSVSHGRESEFVLD